MIFQRSIFILLFYFGYLLNNYLIAQQFSSEIFQNKYIFFYIFILESLTDLPRLCAYHHDPSKYYPCVLNYIGRNSWALYRCPDRSTFDEVSQQCLVKIPINDAFEQFASLPSVENAQFHRIASFILATPISNDDQDLQQQKQQQRGIVSFPPTIENLMDPFSYKKLLNKVKIEIKIKTCFFYIYFLAN
jgi:hypothetical protein